MTPSRIPQPHASPHPPTAAVPARCDVLVVGGGVNGACIARDLAGRGLSVVLCEQDDLAQHTSSASTKLIHGGLRYLEYREFALVRKALAEREVLLASAPHIMRPLGFVMPLDPDDRTLRPAWMIRAGLFLYDHLARRRTLPASHGVDLRRHVAGQPLQARFAKGFVYSDGWVDDARLVVLCALDAAERGATVLTRWRCEAADAQADGWQVRLQPTDGSGSARALQARALVNATGPWAAHFLREQLRQPDTRGLRLVKGSHIVVPRLFEHDQAYILQAPDRRVVFAIPYEGDFTLIGTTDVDYHGDPAGVRIDDAEARYLCEQVSRYFARPVKPSDAVWSYSGVRPLIDDESGNPAAATRDYRLELQAAAAPLLNVWGGKLTTSRRLAEEAAGMLCEALGVPHGPWTAGVPLPGGDFQGWLGGPPQAGSDVERFERTLAARHPELPAPVCHRWARAYGSRAERLLAANGLGQRVAHGVFEAELRYLWHTEWARSVEDVLWRRSKLGLHLGAADQARIAQWWATRLPAGADEAARPVHGG